MPDIKVVNGFYGTITIGGEVVGHVKDATIKFDFDTLYGHPIPTPEIIVFDCGFDTEDEMGRYLSWLEAWEGFEWPGRWDLSISTAAVRESFDNLQRAQAALTRANRNLSDSTRNIQIATWLIALSCAVRVVSAIWHVWRQH